MHSPCRVNQAEDVIHILAVAPQEYVNIYSTRRGLVCVSQAGYVPCGALGY